MDEAEQVSSLIGNIYDAALDPALWPEVLEATCRYVEGMTCALMAQDSAQASAQLYFTWGTDPRYDKSYLETYGKLTPLLVPSQLYAKVGDVVSTTDLVPYDEFLASRFYREWAEPQGVVDVVGAVLDKSATSYGLVAVQRHQRHGLVDDKARRRMALLAPHFRRAVAIGKVIDLHKVAAATFADTLDGIAAAMLLVDADGRIAHANAAGQAMLAQGSVIRAAGGKLAARDVQADPALSALFQHARSGDAAVGVQGIAMPLTARGGERYVAHVLPLTSGTRRKAGVVYSAVAAVFVRKASLDLPHPLEAIAAAYKLTSAEMRVLMAIVQIGGVPEVAPMLGIAETTVKTHLQNVYAKTGTSRQADLVKLVAGYMSPLN